MTNSCPLPCPLLLHAGRRWSGRSNMQMRSSGWAFLHQGVNRHARTSVRIPEYHPPRPLTSCHSRVLAIQRCAASWTTRLQQDDPGQGSRHRQRSNLHCHVG